MEYAVLKKVKQSTHPLKKPKEYREGHEASQDFEKAMKTLFRAPKVTKKGKD
jgi:hypothetical protein